MIIKKNKFQRLPIAISKQINGLIGNVVLCAIVCNSLTKRLNLITIPFTGITDPFNYFILNL